MANVSLLATVADQTASQIVGAISPLLPSGVVLPFAGSSAPSGWLLCEGQEISQTTYASLFAVLSTTYNTQTNPTTGSAWAAPSAGNFRLPDYRGLFLRGAGTASGKDATSLGGYQGEKTKTPASAFTTAAQTVTGSINSTGSAHTHDMTNASYTAAVFQTGGTATSIGMGVGTYGTTTGNSLHTHGHSLTAPASTVNGGGDNETRPLNRGVNYIIKI